MCEGARGPQHAACGHMILIPFVLLALLALASGYALSAEPPPSTSSPASQRGGADPFVHVLHLDEPTPPPEVVLTRVVRSYHRAPVQLQLLERPRR